MSRKESRVCLWNRLQQIDHMQAQVLKELYWWRNHKSGLQKAGECKTTLCTINTYRTWTLKAAQIQRWLWQILGKEETSRGTELWRVIKIMDKNLAKSRNHSYYKGGEVGGDGGSSECLPTQHDVISMLEVTGLSFPKKITDTRQTFTGISHWDFRVNLLQQLVLLWHLYLFLYF